MLPDSQVAVSQECLTLFVEGNGSDSLSLSCRSLHISTYLWLMGMDPKLDDRLPRGSHAQDKSWEFPGNYS